MQDQITLPGAIAVPRRFVRNCNRCNFRWRASALLRACKYFHCDYPNLRDFVRALCDIVSQCNRNGGQRHLADLGEKIDRPKPPLIIGAGSVEESFSAASSQWVPATNAGRKPSRRCRKAGPFHYANLPSSAGKRSPALTLPKELELLHRPKQDS